MKKTFEAFFDDLFTITAELDLHYYDGISEHFKVIDDQNNYHDVMIKNEEKTTTKRVYELYVEGLIIGENYYIVDEHFLKTPVSYRYVVRTEAFDQMFYYAGDDLGPTYSPTATTFKVWAPTASRVILDIENETYEMSRQEKGVYSVTVEKDLDGKTYHYLLNISSEWQQGTDPYALSSTPNHKQSVVIDLDKVQIDLHKEMLPEFIQKTDAIIYEMHVRDCSSDEQSGIHNKGKFLGLTEEGTQTPNGDSTGLDYLTDLGFTHLQLLPIYDFGSVDELNQFAHYNWGYDPVQYNIPEGSYASDVMDPYSRIRDLKLMVSKLHNKGLRVVMDVVYNHMFDRFSSNFESLVPYYYFRIGQEGVVSNGSFCGNDFDSTRKMARKYILESIKQWMNIYGIDGFRFDLMGILDVDTMNQVADLVENIDPTAMVYGEGWNMPTLLDDEDKATMMNQEKMPKIGHFNDLFRDTIKGGSMSEEATLKGICLGDLKHLNKLPNLLTGSNLNNDKETFFDAPWKSVNYVECHDNQTVFDKMVSCNVSAEQLISRQKLMLAVVLFSQGIPFIHAGQEFCRTKGGNHNSYMSNDEENKMDWLRMAEHKTVVQFVKDAIEIRKTTPEFKHMNYEKTVKAKVKKLKKIVEVSYDKSLKLIINFGSQTEVKLKNDEIIFNKNGHANIKENYTLDHLELIIIKKA